MKKRIQTVLALILALSTALTLLCGSAWAANPTSGKCGANLTWTLKNHILTISGSGAMTNYGTTAPPWMPLWESITRIVIKNGVTTIGNNALSPDFEQENEEDEDEPVVLSPITLQLPGTLKSIGKFACSGLTITNVTIPAKVTKLGEEAFSYTPLRSVTFAAGSKLTTLGDGVFLESRKLSRIDLPASVKTVGASLCESKAKVCFKGNAPKFHEDTFDSLTGITAYYPAGNKTWTKAKLKNYNSDAKVAWKKWNPKQTAISSVKGGTKTIAVKWQKVGVTGYQVQYATNAKLQSAKTVNVKEGAKVPYTIKNLKAGTRYYIRVRTYITDSKKNYFSAWSAVTNVATAK